MVEIAYTPTSPTDKKFENFKRVDVDYAFLYLTSTGGSSLSDNFILTGIQITAGKESAGTTGVRAYLNNTSQIIAGLIISPTIINTSAHNAIFIPIPNWSLKKGTILGAIVDADTAGSVSFIGYRDVI